MLFALTLFAGRLVQLQGLQSVRYRTLASQQRSQVAPVPVLRGSVTAAGGAVLAMTVQNDQVFADPGLIPLASRGQVAARLAAPLQMPAAAILGKLEHPTSRDYVLLKNSVSTTTAVTVTALQLPGVALHPFYTRSYPAGDLGANLIGFTHADTVTGQGGTVITGQAGVEEQYNALLTGRPGSEQYEATTSLEPIAGTEVMLRQPRPAGNLQLTIQPDIQYAAEQECRRQVAATKARNCSIIVMQAHTAKILAMAEYPTFSPARPQTVAQTTDIPVADVFAPGSTAKVITVAAALEQGGQTPLSTYRVPDSIVVDGFSFHDAEHHPVARYTVAGILAYSSNDGMVQVVQHVTPQQQYHYLRAFGLGSPSGLGLPGESAGLLQPPAQWNAAAGLAQERYTLSFGQGVAATAVQMASVYATIANGGVRVQPSLVAGTTSAAGQFTAPPAPPRRRVIRAATARELMTILQQVPKVDTKQGEPWGEIAGYTVAAKTGTAQVGPNLSQYGSSYIGIAPASNPQLVVAVNLQDPQNQYFGDAVAGPAFYHVMKFALQTMKIPPDGGTPPYIRLARP